MYFYPLCKQLPASNQTIQKKTNSLSDARSKINLQHPTNTSIAVGSPTRTSTSDDQQRTSKKKSFDSFLKKWIILSIVCFGTDLSSASVITIFLHVYAPASLITYIFLWHDMSMVINVVCMTCCFTDYENMLIPFKSWKEFRNRSNSTPSVGVPVSKA